MLKNTIHNQHPVHFNFSDKKKTQMTAEFFKIESRIQLTNDQKAVEFKYYHLMNRMNWRLNYQGLDQHRNEIFV